MNEPSERAFWLLTSPALTDRHYAWWDYGRKEDPIACKSVCPVNSEHRTHVRVAPLKVGLVGGKQPDFVWTVHCLCLIQPQVAEFLMEGAFTGYSLRPVQARHRNRKVTQPVPQLFELRVHGRAGRLSTPGLQLSELCPGCGREQYKTVDRGAGVVVDPEAWDGSDIFRAWPLRKYFFVSDRLAKALFKAPFRGFSLVPPEFLDIPSGASCGSYSEWTSDLQWEDWF